MYIEIKGVNFVNKGAELMMHAVLQKVGEKIPQARFVLAPDESSSYKKRAKLGLYQKIWFSKFRIPLGMYFGKYIHKKLREYYGLVCHEEIKFVLDASGFSYSDQWGPGSSVLMAKAIKRWRNNNTKIILLPQAMGPFTSKQIRQAFAQVVEKADLIFPRDEISYKHVTDLVGEQKHVIQAPDFTNLVKGVVPEEFKSKEGRFCIIPNYHMIDKTSSKESKKYIPFLVNCVQHLLKKKILPFILIHEGEQDYWLAKEVCKQCGEDMEIVREVNPLKIKGIIGTCRGVISSRFHGLVSALSQGVPALGTGWSHKYEMLFADYGFPEGCIPVDSSDSEIKKRIVQITDEAKTIQLRQKLTEAAQIQKQRSEKMWDRVFACIGV